MGKRRDACFFFPKFHLVSNASSITRREKERAAIQIYIRLPKLTSLLVYSLSVRKLSHSLFFSVATATCTLWVSCERYPLDIRSKVYARTLPNRLRKTCPFTFRNTYLRIEKPDSRFPRDMAFRAALRGLVDSSCRYPGGFGTAGNLSRRRCICIFTTFDGARRRSRRDGREKSGKNCAEWDSARSQIGKGGKKKGMREGRFPTRPHAARYCIYAFIKFHARRRTLNSSQRATFAI